MGGQHPAGDVTCLWSRGKFLTKQGAWTAGHPGWAVSCSTLIPRGVPRELRGISSRSGLKWGTEQLSPEPGPLVHRENGRHPKRRLSPGLGTHLSAPLRKPSQPCVDECWLGHERGQQSRQMKASSVPAARDPTLGGCPCTCGPIHQPFPCLTPAAGDSGWEGRGLER